jgi:multidrug efflux pump
MTGVVAWAVARGRMILALMLLSVFGGVAAYVGLPKEGSPNIDIPVLYVSVPLPGVSAADSERLLVKPLESKLRSLENLDEMTAIAAEGHAGVVLKFDFDWDKTQTVADVRALVDEAKAEFPADAKEPTITEINLSEFPILVVTLSGDAPERTLARLAKSLQREIETLSPVLEAALAGYREELVEVVVDPLLLEAYNVTAQDLLAVVAANNALVPAGAIQAPEGRFAVRLPGSFQTERDIYRTPVKVSGDRVVTISDIASIRRTFEDAEGTARFNGEPAIAIQVKKRLGENIIDTIAQVKERVEAVRATWPEPLRDSVRVGFSMDESRQVRDMVAQLEGSVALAVALVVAAVVLTLGARSSLLVGVTIPATFLLSFALLALFGMSVNNMVMFGMILAVGMLVDAGIVVTEYADRLLDEGVEPDRAYAEAATRMFWPIASSTATTLCAFLPMLFWPGLPGKFMGTLPVTLIFVLSASMIVALIFLPVLGGVTGRIAVGLGRAARRLRAAAGLRPRAPRPPPAPGRRTAFGRLIALVVMNPVGPLVAIGAIFALMVGVFGYFQTHSRGVEFFVETEPERAIVHVRARGNLSLAEKDALLAQVEERALGVEGLSSVFAFAGDSGFDRQGGEGPKDAIGQIQVELAPWGQRPPGAEVLADLGRAIEGVPGVLTEIAKQEEGPEQGKPIQLRLESTDWPALLAAADRVSTLFRGVEGLVAVEDTRPLPGIDWEVTVDREAAGRFGADIQTVGVLVQLVTRGALLDTIRPDDSEEEIDIRVRFPADQRTLATLEGMKMRTENGLVPLGNFLTVAPVPALAEIARFDGMRFITVKADVAPGVNVNDRIAEIARLLGDDPPEGVRFTFQGDQEEQAESQAFLVNALIAAMGLIFAILLAQFNSLYNSVLVLTAVALSFTGVMIGMLVMDQTFSIIMTGTGVVALAGIVVNNNIILIDTYQEFSATMPPLEAIVRTAEQRLRPVFLTTFTTMVGLMPMMFAASVDLSAIPAALGAVWAAGPFSGAAWSGFYGSVVQFGAPAAVWWTQLATAVVFGLGVSTVLTLVGTPAALALRVWWGSGLSAAIARFDGRRLAERRLRRTAGRTPPPELLWDAAEEPPAARPAYPPRSYADAAE